MPEQTISPELPPISCVSWRSDKKRVCFFAYFGKNLNLLDNPVFFRYNVFWSKTDAFGMRTAFRNVLRSAFLQLTAVLSAAIRTAFPNGSLRHRPRIFIFFVLRPAARFAENASFGSAFSTKAGLFSLLRRRQYSGNGFSAPQKRPCGRPLCNVILSAFQNL